MVRRILLVAVALLSVTPAFAQQPGRRYALCVGVIDYKGTQLTNLRHAENDVTALATILRADGYRLVTLMTKKEHFAKQQDSLRPEAANIRAYLKSFLADRQKGDTVLLAFSGHGVNLKSTKQLYFCPEKADLDKPAETLIAITEIYDALKACAAETKLLIIDACRDEVVSTRSAEVGQLTSLTRPPVPAAPKGVAVVFSCSEGEKAYESRKYDHGVFFHHLIEGLGGKAANTKGEVLFESLLGYVKGEIGATLLDEFGPGVSQKPDVHGMVSGAVTLIRGKSPNLLARQAYELTKAKDYPKAVVKFSEAIKAEPKSAALWRDRGDAYVKSKDYDKAAADFAEAVRLDPAKALPHYDWAWMLQAQGKHREAVTKFTEAVRLDPKLVDGLRGRAHCFAALKEYEKAVADFTAAIELDATDINSYLGRADAYEDRRDYRRAIADYSECVSRKPNEPRYLNLRGWVYKLAGKHDLALADFDKAIKLDPRFASAYKNRAEVALHRKQYQKALDDSDKAILYSPTMAEAFRNRGNAYYGLNNLERAIDSFGEHLKLNPRSAEGFYDRGWAHKDRKDLNSAYSDFTSATQIEPRYADAFRSRGDVQLERKRYAEALTDYETALRIDPRRVEAYRGQAKAYDAQGKAAEAQKAAAKFRELTGKNP